MITFKSVFGPHKRKDGKLAVRIRITYNRKIGYFTTPYSVTTDLLNKKGELLVNEYNKDLIEDLNRRISDYTLKLSSLGGRMETMSVKEVVTELLKPAHKEGINLIPYFEKKVNDFALTKTLGTISGYTAALHRFKLFLNKDVLYPKEFTVRLLNDFEIHLRTVSPTFNGVTKKKTISNTTIRLYTAYLSALCNIAEQEDILNVNPYRKGYKKVKQDVPDKRNLEIDLLRIIANDTPSDTLEQLAHDVFMISFMLCGMNTADLYYCPLSKRNRITYERRKTRTRRRDKALISIEIHPHLRKYLERYTDRKRQFNFHKLYTNPGQFNKRVNKGLEKMCKRLEIDTITTYYTRHSFATIARNDLHIPKEDIHLALNHSSAKDMTDVYLATDWSIIDRTNRKVIDYLFKSKGGMKVVGL
jgi:integrase